MQLENRTPPATARAMEGQCLAGADLERNAPIERGAAGHGERSARSPIRVSGRDRMLLGIGFAFLCAACSPPAPSPLSSDGGLATDEASLSPAAWEDTIRQCTNEAVDERTGVTWVFETGRFTANDQTVEIRVKATSEGSTRDFGTLLLHRSLRDDPPRWFDRSAARLGPGAGLSLRLVENENGDRATRVEHHTTGVTANENDARCIEERFGLCDPPALLSCEGEECACRLD